MPSGGPLQRESCDCEVSVLVECVELRRCLNRRASASMPSGVNKSLVIVMCLSSWSAEDPDTRCLG